MAFDAFALILTMLALGMLFARLDVLPDSAAETLNRVVLYVCLPAAVLIYVPRLRFDPSLVGVAVTPWLLAVISSLLVLALARVLRLRRDETGALLLLTAPFTPIRALRIPTKPIISTISRIRLSPACRIRSCPAQAVTPATSRPALTTKSAAMKMTAGSPKPARLWFNVSMPVAQSDSAAPTQTPMTGRRSHMNSTMIAAMIAKTVQISLTDPTFKSLADADIASADAPVARQKNYKLLD